MRRADFRDWGIATVLAAAAICGASSQSPSGRPQPENTVAGKGIADDSVQAELRAGTQLTRAGSLGEAIPHLLAARAGGADPYATGVNLAICYLGTGATGKAIPLLESLRSSGYRTATTTTLLIQAYIAANRLNDAWTTLAGAAETAQNAEPMYAYAADACTDHRAFALGLRMMDLGLTKLPGSARLHYEKALFLAQLGSIEQARPEFDRAAELDGDGYIGYLARVQKDLYGDDLKAANLVLEQAIHSGRSDYRMLSLLGTVLLQEGAAPGDPRFSEARAALEESAKEHRDFSATQIGLGKIDLMLAQYREAVGHLEIARALEPDNPAIYTSLAAAYRHLGEPQKASQATAELGRLLLRKAPKTPLDGGSRPE